MIESLTINTVQPSNTWKIHKHQQKGNRTNDGHVSEDGPGTNGWKANVLGDRHTARTCC